MLRPGDHDGRLIDETVVRLVEQQRRRERAELAEQIGVVTAMVVLKTLGPLMGR